MTEPKMTMMIGGNVPATWNGRVELCKGCGGKIGWALVNETKKFKPFNLDHNCSSHFSTCSKAGEFRAKAKKTFNTRGSIG